MELITKAVIMAGGEGTRLRPYTKMTPKAMLEVNGIPLLRIMIEKLHSFGITHFYLSVNYLSKVICDYFGDGSKFGVDITYIKEPYSMGTAGSISMVDIQEPFLVINGDVYTDLDFRDFFVEFRRSKSDLFICCREQMLKTDYGVITKEGDRIISWVEKPEFEHYISCGIYVFKPEIIEYIPKQHFCGMNHLAQMVITNNKKAGFYLMDDLETWIDIGTIEEYKKVKTLLTGKKM